MCRGAERLSGANRNKWNRNNFRQNPKKLMDMMIHSIYTHKEIFLRELISNASDAIDKLYFKSLTDDSVGMNKSDFKITLAVDKDARTLTITDNGIGMTKAEMEEHLGTIANSGSLQFKKENNLAEDNQIIGQFGVGFYSAFMVSKRVTVKSLAFGEKQAYVWQSEGVEGYTMDTCEKDTVGYGDHTGTAGRCGSRCRGQRRRKLQRIPRPVPNSESGKAVQRLYSLPDLYGHDQEPEERGFRRVRGICGKCHIEQHGAAVA